MKHKQFARLNHEFLPMIGFGCWSIGGEWDNTDDAASITAIHAALDLGINFFDTAPIYGKGHSETVLGHALVGRQRSEFFIASKCGLLWNARHEVTVNLSRKALHEEINRSLRRLKVDYLDLWQCHWPDANTDLRETMEAMEEIRQQGKVRYLGLSNYSLKALEQANAVAEVASFQGLYNLLEQNPETYHGIPLTYKTRDEILPYCEAQGMMYLPYSPLMQGVLTGAFKQDGNFSGTDKRAENPRLTGEPLKMYLAAVAELQALAQEIGRPLAQVAINWLTRQPAVGPVIAGLDRKEHAESTVAATEWELDAGTLDKIAAILAKYPLD